MPNRRPGYDPRPLDNPHLDLTSQLACMPPDHPANEGSMLTMMQRFALPILLWFFDVHRARGTGRSVLMAHVIIELAKRGHEVELEDHDVLIMPRHSSRHRMDYLVHKVLDIAREHYSRDIFEYSMQRRTLIYRGRRPQ